jgi:hypothetical protein
VRCGLRNRLRRGWHSGLDRRLKSRLKRGLHRRLNNVLPTGLDTRQGRTQRRYLSNRRRRFDGRNSWRNPGMGSGCRRLRGRIVKDRLGHFRRCDSKTFGSSFRSLGLGVSLEFRAATAARHVAADNERQVVVKGAGVGLLIVDAQLGKKLDNNTRLHFELACQLVDANFAHTVRH